MNFHVVTIFPDMIDAYADQSILGRAQEGGLLSVTAYNPRDYTDDKHHKTDDRPYGGGPGMVMLAEPLLRTVQDIRGQITKRNAKARIKTIILSPGGATFTNQYAEKAQRSYTDIIFICGRYEGIDARVRKILRAEEVSIGDYVVTGGELPALVMIDAIARQVPGVLGKAESIEENRISSHEMYTRPEVLEWQGKKYWVPPVLLSGDHKKIDEWRSGKE